MATETLSFLCPHCEIRLTVPVALAGVKGPCPNCRMPITAPTPATTEPAPFGETAPPPLSSVPAVEAAAPLPSMPASGDAASAAPPPHEIPPPAPAPVPVSEAPVPAPPPQPELPLAPVEAVAPPVEAPAAAADTPPASEDEAAAPEGPKIRPEPRGMKDRQMASPMSVRHSTADERMRRQSPIMPPSARQRPPSRVMLALIPAVFCAAATVLSGLLLAYYLPNGPIRAARRASEPLNPPPAPQQQQQQGVAANPQAAPSPSPAPAPGPETTPPPAEPPLPAPGENPPAIAPDPAPSSKREDEVSAAVRANQVLDAFLKAKDAQSRVGLVEPEATLAQLQGWAVTRGPLWEVAQIAYDLPQHDPTEDVTDYPYRVTFFIPNRKSVEFAMLVRKRGAQPPRVFLPAFLDLAGGGLAEYASKPNDRDPETFHVVLEPLTGCHEEGVPNPDRKFTLKLLGSTLGKETARAYDSISSKHKQTIDSPESSLRWGVRLRATVTLQWNHKEDPEHPYLELIDINSLGWNP